MSCKTHPDHPHVHGEQCSHTRIRHDGHVDYPHDGHLHSKHGDHYDEHTITVSDTNPDTCLPTDCVCNHGTCEHERVLHGDHEDFLVNGRLHHRHGDHCDDHGPVELVA